MNLKKIIKTNIFTTVTTTALTLIAIENSYGMDDDHRFNHACNHAVVISQPPIYPKVREDIKAKKLRAKKELKKNTEYMDAKTSDPRKQEIKERIERKALKESPAEKMKERQLPELGPLVERRHIIHRLIAIYHRPKLTNLSLTGHESFFQVRPRGAIFSARVNNGESTEVYNYFHMRLDCLFSPNEILDKGPIVNLVHKYTVSAAPMHWTVLHTWVPSPRATGIEIMNDFYPKGVEGETKASDEIGFTVDGKIGIDASMASVASADIGVSLDIKRTTERVIKDVSFVPRHGPRKNVKWDINMNNLTGRVEGGNDLSRGTFTPEFEWKWKIKQQDAIDSGLYMQVPVAGQEEPDYYFPIGFKVKARFRQVHAAPHGTPGPLKPLLRAPLKVPVKVVSPNDGLIKGPGQSCAVFLIKVPKAPSEAAFAKIS